ncbi:MAG: hypothetical protein ACRDZO_02825 [Egibacteraceae bacterium]
MTGPLNQRRRAVALLCLLLAIFLVPTAARAQSSIDTVVESLGSDPLYIDQSAESALPPAGAQRLRAAIAEAGTPVAVAIVPAREGAPRALIQEIGPRLDRPVTLAVISGRSFGAGSSVIDGAGSLADAALAEHAGDGAEAILLDFVRRVDNAAAATQAQARDVAREPAPSGGGSLFLPIVLVIGAGALGFFALRGKRQRDAQRQREFADVRAAVEEDLVALGEDIRALDLDVSMPGVDPRAVEDYSTALDRYQKASDTFDRAHQAPDLAPVTSALEEGRYLMTSSRARLGGEEPPERRPPCFFDPRHGPSVTDVEWAPEGGAPRMVPACAADAQQIRDGLEPRSRQVMVDGTPMPYWGAPSWFSPWAGGYFGFGGTGLFTGLLLGQALGDWGGGFGGDFGGGDFGGGDFGGGDWGGGDFGGGDF